MPKPYKVFRVSPLSPDADLVDVSGRPHVRVKGKLYRVTKSRNRLPRAVEAVVL